jgi:uncharacterized 2Fe-2S/4Fe-4S cluster protein (DUF4445 family)
VNHRKEEMREMDVSTEKDANREDIAAPESHAPSQAETTRQRDVRREREAPVTFQPGGRTVYVLHGSQLTEAAQGAGLVIDQPCGGAGTCGKCRVRLLDGAVEPVGAEIQFLSDRELRDGWRLACQTVVDEPLSVEVPDTSLLVSGVKILAEVGSAEGAVDDPPVLKRHVELPVPSRGDDAPDLVRLERVTGPFDVGLDLLREMPARLREAEFRGTAVVAEGRLIDFEPGDTSTAAYAVATDVGTTTLASALVDLHSGGQLAVVSRANPQIRYGDDVLARILHASESPAGLDQLRKSIVGAVDEMIGELAGKVGIAREQIYALTFSGNTTMQQLFCGVDPRPLGTVPFVPAAGRGLTLPAGGLGLKVHPRAAAYFMPVIGGFVGGDATAGILATAIVQCPGPALLVDIGTNGEIVLWADGKLSAASTAAGPAFEGARISCGMRGVQGAIEKVVVDGRLRLGVIGDVAPRGLCGSGLIDLVAELLRHGVLTPQGRLRTPDQLAGDVPADLAQRIVMHDDQVGFRLAAKGETADGKPIVLTQRDFRETQLATGAIRAGVAILLERARVKPEELEMVLVAGAFGNFVRRSNAQRIGLLPQGVEHRRIRYMGNTSLWGARLAALSLKVRKLTDELAERTEHVDLSTNPAFQTAFADAMIFPDAGE